MRHSACFAALVTALPACALVFDTSQLLDGAAGDDAGSAATADATGDAPRSDAPDWSDAGDGATGGPLDAGCAIADDLFPCSSLPHFAGHQTVDALPYEFCNFHSFRFDVANGQVPRPPTGAPDVTTVAYVSAGWDADGLHMFVHVVQSPVNAPSDFIWNGDAIEVYASANDMRSGFFGPGADPALHVIVAPPGLQPAQSSTSWWDHGLLPPGLDPSLYAARIVPTGYDVELFLPWTVIAAQSPVPPPVAGSTIALDLSCDIQAPDGGRAFQSSLSFQPAGAPSCDVEAGVAVQPFCDDRTWCTWMLAGQ